MAAIMLEMAKNMMSNWKPEPKKKDEDEKEREMVIKKQRFNGYRDKVKIDLLLCILKKLWWQDKVIKIYYTHNILLLSFLEKGYFEWSITSYLVKIINIPLNLYSNYL